MRHWKMRPRWDWRWYFRRDIHGRMIEADKYAAIVMTIYIMALAALVGFS